MPARRSRVPPDPPRIAINGRYLDEIRTRIEYGRDTRSAGYIGQGSWWGPGGNAPEKQGSQLQWVVVLDIPTTTWLALISSVTSSVMATVIGAMLYGASSPSCP